jgi:hypothetical protein
MRVAVPNQLQRLRRRLSAYRATRIETAGMTVIVSVSLPAIRLFVVARAITVTG